MKRTVILCGLLLLLLAQSTFVIASAAAYRMDWFNLVSGSGGPASSAAYNIDITVGQTVGGSASSPGYKLQMGYWSGAGAADYKIFLPQIQRVAP